ncbi:MAG: hypothetical protein Q4A07_04790 [Coriobacteriales bacterium]|nr:hypothetical protein [Coriobacteriales bacterium]
MAINTRDDLANEQDDTRGIGREAVMADHSKEITQAEIDAIVEEWDSRGEDP